MPQATKTPKRQRKKRDSSELKNDILQSAVKAFAQSGYDGASLMNIAANAGTRHPLLLYHFGSKEELWRTTMSHIFDELKTEYAAVTELSRDLSALDQLKLFIRAFVQFSARNPERVILVLVEMRQESERLNWLTEEYLVGLLGRLNHLLDQVEKDGLLKPIPRYHLAYILIGSVSTLFMVETMVQRVYNVDVHSPDVVSAHADWIVEMILNGLIAPKP
ncbi:MAG: TetR/AcrR family transcriptional regulator [Alphaproteobacteria bacterium]